MINQLGGQASGLTSKTPYALKIHSNKINILFTGQSLAVGLFSSNDSGSSGGRTAVETTIETLFPGVNAKTYNGAQGGSFTRKTDADLYSDINYWVDDTDKASLADGPELIDAINLYTGSGDGDLSCVVHIIGSSDSLEASSENKDSLKRCYRYIFRRLREEFGDVPVILVPLGKEDVARDVGAEIVRKLQMELIAADCNIHEGPVYYDLSYTDVRHLTDEGYVDFGERIGRVIAKLIGADISEGILGPKLCSASIKGNVVTAKLISEAGNSISGALGLRAFLDGGREIALGSAAVNSNSELIVLLRENPQGNVLLDPAYASMSTQTEFIKDTSAQGMPLRPKEIQARHSFVDPSTLLAIGQNASPTLKAYNMEDWSVLGTPDVLPAGDVRGIAFNEDKTFCAVAHKNAPYVSIYDITKKPWVKLQSPVALPSNTVKGVSFSPDGNLLALGHDGWPFVTIYNVSDWSKINNPAILPGGHVQDLCFSPDGSFLALAHTGLPYVTIYNTKDWSKVADPLQLPRGNAKGVAFNHDKTLLAVAHYTSPYITVYNVSDWSKINDPSQLPGEDANRVAFDPDGRILAVVHNGSPYLTMYNTKDWEKIPDPVELPTGTGNRVVFDAAGLRLCVMSNGAPYLFLYNTQDWSKILIPQDLLSGSGSGAAFN